MSIQKPSHRKCQLGGVKWIALLGLFFFILWKTFWVCRVGVASLIYFQRWLLPHVSIYRLGQCHSSVGWKEMRVRAAYRRSRAGIVLPLRVTLLLLVDRRGLWQWPRRYHPQCLQWWPLAAAQWLSAGLSEEQVKSAMKVIHESSEARSESLW